MEAMWRYKAMTCITREGASGPEVLLLYHPDHPDAGIQIPAGTVEPGEAIVAAALREAYEETGLTGLELVGILGVREVDMRPWGKNEWHHRTFVHLRCTQVTPSRWEHWERFAFDAPGEPIRFELVWTPLGTLPPMSGGYDAFLDMLDPTIFAP